eukprot:665787-Amphidinium_carterae.1
MLPGLLPNQARMKQQRARAREMRQQDATNDLSTQFGRNGPTRKWCYGEVMALSLVYITIILIHSRADEIAHTSLVEDPGEDWDDDDDDEDGIMGGHLANMTQVASQCKAFSRLEIGNCCKSSQRI